MDKLASILCSNIRLIVILVGYTLVQFAFNWGLSVGDMQNLLSRPLEPNAMVNLGEAVGFVVLMAISLKKPNFAQKLSFACFVAFMAGTICIMLCAIYARAMLALVGNAIFGFGYATVSILYLACAAELPPKKMLVVLSLAYIFNLASYPVILDIRFSMGCVYALAAIVGGALLVPSANSLSQRSGQSASPTFLRQQEKAYFPTWQLIAFSVILPFAYGFCSSHLGLGVSIFGYKIGVAIPAIIIIASLLLLRENFSLNGLYIITCPLMIAGLFCSFLLAAHPFPSKILISTSLSAAYLIAYLIIKVRSQENAQSPIMAFTLVSLIIIASNKTGKEIEYLVANTPLETSAMAVLVIAVVLSYGFMLMSSREDHPFNVESMISGESRQNYALVIAQEKDLSKREMSVYLLLLDNKTNGEIANELFIAPSTVRAHISRIYEKFGVHTRQELYRAIQG